MTMGWHMMMQFAPALFGCYLWEGNHSYELIRSSRECVINIPTAELAEIVVSVGNSSGSELDKFEAFGLTATSAACVGAPLINECYANFECRLADDRQIDEYGLFIWKSLRDTSRLRLPSQKRCTTAVRVIFELLCVCLISATDSSRRISSTVPDCGRHWASRPPRDGTSAKNG